MNPFKLPLACLLIISTAFATLVAGQQKPRVPEKPVVKTPAAPAPVTPVTLDTLLAADSYKVYVEVRGVGQLIRSNSANDLLDPVLKLGGPPPQFLEIVDWLRVHADQMMTSRLLVAFWPTFKEVPDAVVAVEMPTAEDAEKFERQLNGVLPTILPPVMPQSSPEGPPVDSPQSEKPKEQATTDKPKPAASPMPGYYLQRADSLILISPKPIQLKKLKPKGSKPYSEDANFRTAYNRFGSEPIFAFVNFNAIQKENEEREKQYQEERKKAEEAEKAAAEKLAAEAEKEGEAGEEGEPMEEAEPMEPPVPEETPTIIEATPKEPTEAEVLGSALSSLRYSLMSNIPDLPDALGIGFSPENDSFDVRVLLIDSPGERSDPVPLFSGLMLGEQFSPESPRVIPADSELVVTLSLDFGMIYAYVEVVEQANSTQATSLSSEPGARPVAHVAPPELVSPLKTVERMLKINAKEELIPLLGSEVAISMPLTEFNFFGPPRTARRTPKKEGEKEEEEAPRGPIVVISLRDREGMRRLMPRLLEGFAGKAAAALAQTERREDTELITIGGVFSYAFVGNFLVLAGDVATTRHVVDSYLKGETLSADTNFKTYTRWQPRELQGQVYVSPVLSESYRMWANSPTAQISDDARDFLSRLSATAQPITYSLSNDGLGALHELHVPKSFLVLTVASMVSAANPPQTVKNERQAMSSLWQLSYAQRSYKEKNGSRYGSIEELVAEGMLSEEALKTEHYKFAMTITPEGFEVSAVPVEYGKTGKLSFFMDQSGVMRAADHGGGAATASDDPIGE